ncbi:YDG domain-containing protein [Pantoea sp. 18069]|uniref:YDG domain-containing protein n=1 Tax=Pantoea sp. 18069 TaxID=2681415 RepID=UPI001356CEAF|nr:YDG domain-containing protein [Pantoea sp. 18069]
MNHIYRSIWSEKLGTYVAVAETAVSAGKKVSSSSSGAGHFAVTALAAALCLGWGGAALANPTGGVVMAGSASISSAAGNTTIVQGSQNAAINWQSFNIGAGEAVRFVQPNANAVALNRVIGSDPSKILGSLSANGKVFLVNPNGIMFGAGASVNVGGLVASTLSLTDSDFLAGRYRFSGNSRAGVSNQGQINAPGGYVALLGANVGNTGAITARLGTVALAAGQAVTLDVAGDGLLNLSVDQGAVNALVDNGGLIQADGGQVLMTAQAVGDLLNSVVNNTGVVQAQTIDNRGGTIKLLGDMRSGTVIVGGTLDASAAGGGNGGFIETSAANVKYNGAKITTAAPQGITGSWLIDPTDYTIAASGGNMTGADLSNSLKTTDVTIATVADGAGAGDIHVNDNVSWAANKLTLKAHNNININQAMRGTGTASLALQYGQASVAGTGSGYTVNAEVDLPTGMNFSTQQGSAGSVINYQVINSLGAQGSNTGTDLQGINGNLSGNYVLGSNLDASSSANWNGGLGWKSIGSDATPFTGRFDGLGHEIHGLTMQVSSYSYGYGGAVGVAGLFSRVGAAGQVRNLGLVNASVTMNNGWSYGYGGSGGDGAGGIAGVNEGLIDNVSVNGSFTASGNGRVGGVAGFNFGTIHNSRSSGVLTSGSNYWGGDSYAGGIAAVNGQSLLNGTISSSSSSMAIQAGGAAGGLVALNVGRVIDSFATGAVQGEQYVGGVVGRNQGAVSGSFATGAITGVYSTGGVVGYNANNGTIANSYATGNVAGQDMTGGLLGFAGNGTISNSYSTGDVSGYSYVGGLAGGAQYATFTNTYASGKVSSSSGSAYWSGAFIGYRYGTNITNGYYNSSVNTLGGVGTGNNNGTGDPSGLTVAQMKTASAFAGFNFTGSGGATGNNWVMVKADGTLATNGDTTVSGTMPMLASEYSTTIHSAHQLQLMAMDKTASYTLGSSFSAAGTATTAKDVWGSTGFIPVGTLAASFNGTLDGRGRIVSNLNINQPSVDNAGLFGVVGEAGVVTRVGLDGGSVAGGSNTGALAGINNGTISNSFSSAQVAGGMQVGGLVGANNGTISDSYASGAVSGADLVGGLVGDNAGSLTNSYASGGVTAMDNAAGLVGANSGTVANSFWDTTTSGRTYSDGGTGLTTAQIQALVNFHSATADNGAVNPAWDLTNTWVVYDGQSAPLLRAFMKPLVVRVETGTKVYDGTSASSGNAVTYSNVVNGNLAGTVIYSGTGGGVNVGNYTVSASGLYSLGGQTGYSISYVDGGLVVTQRAVSLDVSKVYDGTTTANLTGGTLSGMVSGETLTFSGGTASNYNDKNVGTSKALLVSGVTLGDGTGGGLASNYVFSGGTGSITAKALTVSGMTAANKTYDGTNAATLSGGMLDGLVAGETLGLSGQSGAFSDQNAAAGKSVTVAGATLSDGTGLASNYTVSNATGVTADITAKALTVSGVTAANKTYDGTNAATLSGGTLNGLVAGETLTLTGQTGAFDNANAGAGKVVTVTGATLADGTGLASNYTVSNATGVTADIAAKALTVSGVTAAHKAYDGNNVAIVSGGTFNGLVGSETLVLSGQTGSFADKNVAAGQAVTVTGATLGNGTGLASNYTVSNATGVTADITAKALTVSGVTAANKTYDGTTLATLSGGTLDGLVAGETLGLSGQSGVFSDQNAAAGKTVTVTGATLADGTGLASNYTVGNATGVTADITAKALTVSGVTAANKTYDGTTLATLSGGTLDGLVAGETLSLSGQTGAFSDQNAAAGKTVTVTGATLADGTGLASNYTVSNATGVTADITAKALTVSGVTAANKTYDGTTLATLSGGTLNGLVGSETLVLSGQTGSFADKNVAAGQTVAVTGATLGNGTGLASNYTVSNATGVTADITAKALTVSGVTAANKTYDGTTLATLSGGTLDGLVAGETLGLSGQSGVFSDQNAAAGKTVTVTGATLADGTGLASNYTVSNATGVTANINAKALTVSGVTAAHKTYDGTTVATLSGGTLNGLVGSEALILSGQSGAFSDQNAAAGKTVTVTGATLANGTGLASNYTVSNATGVTADIIAKVLTVSGVTAADKSYDGTTVATLSGGTLNGLVGSETLTLSGQTGAFGDKNVAAGQTVTVTGATLGNGTGLASNYTVSNATGVMADINAKALTVSGVTAAHKTYDGTTLATLSGGTLNGLVGSETLVLSGQTGSFADKNVAAGQTVAVTGATLGNGTGLASNYTVTNATGVTADITAKALTVSGVTAADKTYDGTTVATLSGGTLEGLVTGETLSFSGQAGAFGNANAGTGKAVTVSGVTLGDGTGLASNYTVSNATGVTADITAKALTVTGVTAANKAYDGTTIATLSGGTLNGLVGSETLTLSGQTGSFSDKNVASGQAVTVTGTTLVDGTGLASNYTVSNATGVTADITAKGLTVSGVTAANKTYDGTTLATLSGGTLDGLVAGETLGLSGQSGVFSDQTAAVGKTVTVTGATLADGTGLASNYTVSNATGVTADITAKALTVSGVTAAHKTYDGTTVATLSGGTLNGLVGSETLILSGQSGAFSDQNAAAGKTVNVTGATLGNGTGLASNYTVSNATGVMADITAKALTISGVTTAHKTYDGTTVATLSGGTLDGLVAGETLGLSGQTGVFSDQNAAAGKNVTVTGATLADGTGLAGNYTVSNATGVTADITAKALTVSGVTAANKTYDGTAVATLSGGTLDGLVGSETLTLSGQSGAFSDQNAAAGKTVNVTGATLGNGTGLASNYTVSNATGVTADITAKALTISGVTAAHKTYDGTTVATLSGGTLDGLVAGETLGLSGQSGVFSDQNAAAGKTVTVTGATLSDGTGLASNYTVSNATGVTADIIAKALTVSGVTAANKTYDGTNAATLSGGTLEGLVADETLGLSGQSGVFSDKNAAVGKNVTVTEATLSDGTGLASNYTVSNATGVTADITAKALTVSGVTAANKTYDGTTVATLSGGTLEGLVADETLGLSGQSGVFSDKNAAVGKNVTVTGATLSDGTGLASNYTVSNATGVTADITAKALTVSGVTAANKTYDGTTVATLSGGTLNGLVGSETLTLSGQTGAFSDQNAAVGKAVTISGATLGNGTGFASNYTVSNATGVTADITTKALTVTGVTAANKTYDGTSVATLSGGTLNGLVGSEMLTLSGQSGTFSDQNAGAGKAVTVTGATLGNDTGLASNYTVSNATGVTADINAKALTVSGVTAANKTYDGTTVATLSGGTLNGLVGAETLILSGQSGAFSDQHAAVGKTVTVTGATLGNGTGLASNYTVSNAAGVTADITAKALTISGVTAADKTYDGTTVATLSGGTLNGLVGSETLTLSGQTGAFGDKNVAAGQTVTVTGATLGNGTGLASNYTVSNATGVTADITAKALTVSGVTAADKTYDGTAVATLSGGTLDGLVAGETLTLSGQSGAFSDQNASAGKTVTVTGATLGNGTGLASNYTVSNAMGVTADITAKALTVSGVTAADKTYDGTAVATLSGGTLNGLVGNETLTLSGQSGAFSDQNAAAGKAVTVTGATLGNGTGLASNYTVSNATDVTASITPKALTVTGMTAQDKIADGSVAATLAGGSLSGLVGSETLGFRGQSGRFDNADVGEAKAVTVSGLTLVNGTGLAGNYSVSNPTGLSASIVAAATVPASTVSEAIAAAQSVVIPVAVGGNVVAPQMVVAQQPMTAADGSPGDNAQMSQSEPEPGAPAQIREVAANNSEPAVRINSGVLPPVLQGMGLDVVGSGVHLAFAPPETGASAAARPASTGDNTQ